MLCFKILSCALFLFRPCLAYLPLGSFSNILQQKLPREFREHSLQSRKRGAIASCNSTSCYRYYNPKTAPYFIESWPDVNFDTGEIYGGSVPIKQSNPSRTLFFIFKPAESGPINEITIWLNGGPGCSSLEGFFQENGPITWRPGTAAPVENQYAWSTLTNMLWVEQPVGTGK